MTTRVLGRDSMISRQASTPSFLGITTSMTITSGDSSEAASTASTPSPGLPHHLKFPGTLQHHLKAFPHDRMVVGQQHPYATRFC